MACSQFPVAIIGMATRLPGAQTCEDFWEMLKNSGDTVAKFPQERIPDIEHAITSFRGQLVNEDDPFFTGSFFHSVDKFDAQLFQINPREALFIEPEQRIFLETTWEALEDAGYASKIRGSNTGVYVGNTVNKYKYILTENHPSISHGNHSPFISSRVSYTHNLQGPAMMVATGCSSSLLAVHIACQGLLSGDCDMAIAGGITLDLLPVSAKTDIWNQLGITGPDVKCRAFDASAKGIAKGEGCGVVVLKPLAKAIVDGDHIYGVLESTTANQDGHSNGITAPHPGAQANMLCKAWELANISPDTLGYFETHGTGTELGDPIEISGITKAFKTCGHSYAANNAEVKKIPIGSVKANIGHLADGAAGVVSLVKVLLCLHKEKIPPAVNFATPNPHINWETSPVYVNTSIKEWRSTEDNPTRYASISAFGLLGTNVHAVVREHHTTHASIPTHPSAHQQHESQLLALAANTKHSLTMFVGKIMKFFHESEKTSYEMLRNVCYTLNTGREQTRYQHRAVIFATTWELMTRALKDLYRDLSSSASPNEIKQASVHCGYSVNIAANSHLNSFEFPGHFQNNAKQFLNGKDICWKKFYPGINKFQKIPLVPNYAFERTRFWPKPGQTINNKLLQLEHGLAPRDQANCRGPKDLPQPDLAEEYVQNKCEEKLDSFRPTIGDVKLIIHSTLNEVLSTNHDWQEMANENLFALGMDSLLCTQLSMKLRNAVNCNITLAAFHKNPTYTGLINLVEVHLNAQEKIHRTTTKLRADKQISAEDEVKMLLGRALNDSLDTNYDWQEKENENLFTLGFDSLTSTQVNMILANALSLDEPFTMTEMRKFPTYSLLWNLIFQKLATKKTTTEIPGQSHDDQASFPLSFSQKRLWVMEEMSVSSCAYNATNCLKISGRFHPEAFTVAANTVLSRHAAFFTTITDTNEGPTQSYNWQLDVKVEELDVQHFADEAEQVTMGLYSNDYKAQFNLRTGPPVQCKLYRLPNDVFYFTVVVHHIVFDGWSHFVFYNELWDTYIKLCEGKKAKEDLHRPLYAEFAKEEQHGSPHAKMQTHVTYWKEKLAGPLPLTTFPGDKRRPAVFTHQGNRITRFIDNDILGAIKDFGSEKYTVFVKLLSVVYALLHQYTGDRDLIIGTPVAGRSDLRFKHVIGCFVNTLALRIQLPDNCTFADILSDVSAVFLKAFDHQLAPFDYIVNQLNLPRDTSITPVFSVNVCYHNTEIKGEHTSPPSDINVQRNLQHNGTTKWDMQFDFLQEPEGMRFTLEYYSDLFSNQYADSIVDNFVWLIKSCCENESTPLAQLVRGTIGQTETTQTLSEVSVLRGPVRPRKKSLPQLLKESFEAHAESTAIIETSGLRVTYRELLQHSVELSLFLRKVCQLPKQSRIGLLLDNSAETAQCILASVFSGLVYVPIDPTSPKPRLEHICDEAEIKAIVFNKSHIGIANHLHWACPSIRSIVCVDSQEFLTIPQVVENSPLMDVELWNCVADKAKDDIESGGWKSSYTGEHMSVEEMEEYAENVLIKLKDYIKPTTRVLEIGCASGLTVQKLCPMVAHYVATDLSDTMTTRLEGELKRKGITNVQVLCASADQIGHTLQGMKFDLIVMNSVVHCFPGHNYLRTVFQACETLLDKGGVIFVGDVMDLELKEKLVRSLKSFKKAHLECRVKTDWRNELFLSRGFMQHLCDSSATLKSVKTSRKHYTVANELTEFRFDTLFTTFGESYQPSKQLVDKRAFALQDIAEAVKNKDTRALQKIVFDWSHDVQREDEVYVLYTSGTTGTPKGVIIGHEALLNYATWATKAYQFDSNTFTPFFAPLTFDFTITSILPPLLGGSVIQIFKPFQDSYQALANSTEITTAKYSPLQLDTILSTTSQRLSASTFILGGEELTPALLHKLKINKRDNPFVVWNEYGPTEATVGCVVRCFVSDELPKTGLEYIPIGKPIDNVTVAVVRNQQDPVPQGAKGHLAIGGKCLCSDFAGSGVARATKRNKSFSASCWGKPGEQMLLTEDIVELMPSTGELVYFGRDRDSKTTKVNGVRVDLMEVQRMIEADPVVTSAWVCTFTHDDRTLLGAAVKLEDVKQNGKRVDLSWKQHLVSSLAQVLPIRSIPKVFVALSAVPTNKNGKKDVSYLQKVFLAEMIDGKENLCNVTTSSNTSSPLQQNFHSNRKLQKIWQSILPINHLPKPEEDFFFDLSGDSLQAIHLVRKMRDEGYQVCVTDIFQNSSIEKLAPILEKRKGDTKSAQIASESEETQFRPTPIVEEFFERHPPLKQPDRFSLSALLNFHDEIQPEILEKALRSVVKKHGSLRSRFSVSEGRVFQQVVPIKLHEFNVEVIEIERSEDHLANEPLFIELCDKMEEGHSLENGHLVNAAIVNVKEKNSPGKQQHFALLVVHHVALDIVSWQQILEDLASALRMLSQNDTEPELSKCQVTFQTYCKALQNEADKVFVNEVEYWRGIEEEYMQSGRLVEEDKQSNFKSAKWVSESIDATLIRSTSRTLGCSDENILLTAFGRAIASIHGHDKTSICLESHGRQLKSVDTTDTVGWCTSSFPVVLDTSPSCDLLSQLKNLRSTMNEIPNHGLGFGLLKSKGLLTMPLPKIMFVFQGSMDAASKETFDGGRFSFDHIPWIEIMLNELREGRFHRHPEEYLEYDLEIIAWIHGGELKFGCLFDGSVVNEEVIRDLIKEAQLNIMAMAEKSKTKPKEVSLEIISAFNITPECLKSMTDGLSHHATIPTEIRVQPPEQMLQFLCTTYTTRNQSTADVTVLIPRPKNAGQADEFVKACGQPSCRITTGKSIIVVNTDNLPNTSKLLAPLPADQVSLEINLPNISCFYDHRSDSKYNMPLTQTGYYHLGTIIARGIRACVWDSKYKVIAVDADYTLWDGECAQGSVHFNEGNLALHDFLLKKKAEGMLLVVLSKNSQTDVESIFELHKSEMELKKNDFAVIIANWESKSRNIRYVSNMLNLGTDSFVFIDDNLVECEEMIQRCPEILTLQLPSSTEFVAPLLDNLWALDRINISAEASKRTELYQSELARQAGLKGIQTSAKEAKISLNKLLLSWGMELKICKTTVGTLRSVKDLYKRAVELLQRTNQFKMNDRKTDLAKASDDDIVWLASLKDKHGTYGIVSVLLLNNKMDDILIAQWVLSCRALGRGVEARILEEIHNEGARVDENTLVKLTVNKTNRNAPALDFLESVGIKTATVSSTELTTVSSERLNLIRSIEPLHNVQAVSAVNLFLENTSEKAVATNNESETRSKQNYDHATTSNHSSTRPIALHESSSQSTALNNNSNKCTSTPLIKLNEWIEKTWSESQKHQSIFHATFPIARIRVSPAPSSPRHLDTSQRECALISSWMEVLHTNKPPQDSDNFIQSGGNSFSAVYLVSMLRRMCAIEISIVDVLQNQTYVDLKKIVEEACSLKEEITSFPQHNPEYRLRLSSAQQRMVLIQQTIPGSTAYVETVAYRISKAIDPKEIISALVQQHPILKSKITVNNEGLEYSIAIDKEKNIDLITDVVDSSEISNDYLKQTTPVISVIDSSLVKARYIIAKNHNVLVLYIHHLIVDDFTLSNIAGDIEQLVQDCTLNEIKLNPCQHYANYVEQEMAYLKSTECKEDEEYWKKTFATLPPESNLAVSPKAQSTSFDTRVYSAKHSTRILSAEATDGITAYCRVSGLTEFQYFLSCTVLVLQRYLGVEEVTLAVPVTTRTENYRKTDGLFVNTVLCRISIDYCTSTMKEHIDAVAAQWLEALRHSHYPFDQVTKALWSTHGKNSSSFCSVMFNYAVRNRKTNELSIGARDAKMPLSLDVINDTQSHKTAIIAEWADQLIDDGVAERLTDSVFQLCSRAYIENTKSLQKIQVLSTQEHDLLESFNTNSTDSRIEACLPVHTRFENFAKMSPTSTAVAIDDRCLSYRQLDELSSKVANALSNRIKEDKLKNSPVIIVGQKNEYAIAAILGVWKAGGHFLPVATTNQNSLENILIRNQPAAILTNLPNGSLIVNENNSQRCPLFSIENLINSTNELNDTRPKTSVQDLAYIIQTSGSTGTPKQCKISHRSLHIIANAWLDRYAMRQFNVNVLQWAPLSFDVFVGDVVRALVCAPGQLTICPDERRLDIPYMLQLIKKHQITMAEVTPLFGQQLVENSDQNELNSIKIFILGSDVLQRHVYHTIKAKLRKDQRLLNSYGMTEATIDSSFFERDTLPVTRSDTVPIGTPLPGVGLHVLDPKTFLPCPVGTVGELYITGEILASGDVDLLEVDNLGCRALKTGDAACWLPSGDVELMGRMDNVVKLRGFRISTAEIENKIVEMVEAVAQACVVPLSNQGTINEFLCAFVVVDCKSSIGIKIDKNHVCSKLKGALPYYMLPDIVQVIKTIPISTNGKVDHKALPAVSKLLENITAPTTESSSHESPSLATLKTLFAEAIGLPDAEQVDQKLTFMEQGAHSLILVKFSTLIKQKTSFSVTIADIFSYPTISALEEYITQETQCSDDVVPQVSNATTVPASNNQSEDIAITGIGLRLPGNIMTLPQLWEVLESGHDLIEDFSKTRTKDVLDCLSQENKETLSEAETFQGVFFKRIDEFDSNFFKIPPGEAKFMSPEQRMFLQVATEALAESKPLSEVHRSKIGVFVGSSEIGYSQLHHPDEATCISGLLPGMIATRVAYQWDLKGPTMLVDTACSSSLMALKEACESIKRGECEGALVGGVSLVLYPSRSGVFGKTSILSKDFKCRPFDKDATGTAVGEGVMCLYAETLEKAVKENKPIYGIVKSIASNSVGRGNGITAPSASSQCDVIQDALKSAKVQPSEITFIEAHGTGTKLGDRIELSALRSLFNDTRESKVNLSIGSVKSVFGHLDSAAGMLGVFKTLASLESKKIPPTAHFKTPHPELVNSRMNVPNETIHWHPSPTENRRIAGVSSFGLTGTNCHAIIAEVPIAKGSNLPEITGQRNYHLLIAGSNLEQIRRQLHLHKIHIRQSILRSGASTLPGMCLTVAKRLKEFVKLKIHIDLKLVITTKAPSQMLKVVEVAEAVTDLRAMIQLARLRSDIEFSCSEFNDVKSASPDVASFLHQGTINVNGLFHGENIRLSPEVTLVIYNESRHWLEPCDRISRGSSRLDVSELLEVKLNETRELVRSLPLAPAVDLEVTLGTFCSAIIIKLFLSTALSRYLANDLEITFKNAFALSEMLPKYEKFFFVMVRELWRNKLLIDTGSNDAAHCLESFVFKCRHLLDTDPTAIANDAVEKYPSWADCFRFPLYCSQHLAKVVRGNMSPISVIYPRGDLNFMFQFDKLGDLLGDVYYNMYMQLIASYAKQLSGQGKQVRILEVGAGVGHVTRQILPKLKDTPNVEYWFTDLGKAFVEHAKTTFADYLHMTKFSTFDITKSAPKQGLLGSFDIIVSYNVIHTTESIMASVVNLKSCLDSDGKLFVIESAKNETWATLAWGILDGWWYFKDYNIRPAEPMMEAEKWEQVLQTAGFQSVITCPNQDDEKDHVEKFMFLCSIKKPVTRFEKSSQSLSNLGWWETDIDRFDPIKKLDDLQDKVSDNARTPDENMDGEQSSVYEALKEIWSELLGEDNIHSEDDFNSLGGESLLAIQMMNIVKKRIGFQLEIADTFGYPTLGSLAGFITDELNKDTNLDVATCGVSKPNQQPDDKTNTSNKNEGCLKTAFQPTNLPALVATVNELEKGTLLMFPGQGSQKVGMCVSMKDSIEARKVFGLAEEVLGYNVLDICLGDGITLEKKLKSTEFVQVALFVGCLAKIEQLKVERPDILAKVTHVTGLSVGEFAALVYAGVIGFQDALKLVYARGKAMEQIVMKTPTGMVSVFGPQCKQLETFLEKNHPYMMISTYLADNQHTVGGTDQECDAFVESLSQEHKEDMDLIDVRKLRVAGAFHSPYMDEASKEVNNLITGMEFSKPSVPIIMNVNGDIVTDPMKIKKFLSEQLTAAVKWKQSIITAHALSIRSFIEIAPGRVLSSIVKKRIKECQGCDVEYIQV